MPTPTPTEFHFPCWALTTDEDLPTETDYTVWAPGDVTDQGRPTGKRRDHWQAAWDRDGGNHGDVRKGDSMAEVLALFPKDVADAFAAVIEAWQAEEGRS